VKLEEANAQLCVELAAAHTKVAKVEHCERSMTSNYDGLHRDFNDLQTSHATVVKEKVDLEKLERKKAQRFCNQLCTKLPRFWYDMEESIAALGGDEWISPLPMPLSLTCRSGFERRSNRCLPPLPSATRI
jgi:hypothetical protein